MSFQLSIAKQDLSPAYQMKLEALAIDELDGSEWDRNLKKLGHDILANIHTRFIDSFENKEHGDEIFLKITGVPLSHRAEGEGREQEAEEAPSLIERMLGAFYGAVLGFYNPSEMIPA